MAPKKLPKSKLGKTALFYRKNKASRDKKKKVDTEIMKRPEQKKKNADLKKRRRKAIKQGKNIKNLDYDHKQKKFIPSQKNRGQKEKSRLVGSKRKKK